MYTGKIINTTRDRKLILFGVRELKVRGKGVGEGKEGGKERKEKGMEGGRKREGEEQLRGWYKEREKEKRNEMKGKRRK